MFGIGFPELVVIFIVALLVLGPERLPELARGAARWVQEVRKAADELKKELGAEEIQKGREEVEKVREALLKDIYVPPDLSEYKPTPRKFSSKGEKTASQEKENSQEKKEESGKA